jgi:hypothetical protein
VALVSRENGAGLSTDMSLLEELFSNAGHQVTRVDWQERAIAPCDVAVFLELLQPRLFQYARATVGVFNMEWFMRPWERHLRNMTQLWAKSSDAMTAYGRIGVRRRARLTGFASRDVFDPGVIRRNRVMHLKGHSDLKNTNAVLEAWRRHGTGLPELVVVANEPVGSLPPNVTQLSRVPDAELFRLMNECQIHLCPSGAEGWGHYITEGLSAGAAVITTDAPPMNEHVRSDFGFLLKPTTVNRRGRVFEYGVDPNEIARAVAAAVALSPEERARQSSNARSHVLQRNADFAALALKLIGEL